MRFPLSSTLTFAAFALAPVVLMTVATPAFAQAPSGDYRCTALPAQARAAAAAPGADASAAARARQAIAVGQQLCAARAEGAAARQFRRALNVLNVQEVRAATPADIAGNPGAPAGGNN